MKEKQLLKQKKWYSLKDASKRLSLFFEEEISLNDIIQLIVDKELNVSWYLQHGYIREVSFYVPDQNFVNDLEKGKINPEDILTPEFISALLQMQFDEESYGEQKIVKPESPVFTVTEIFSIDIELNGGFYDWLLSHLTKSHNELNQIDGLFVNKGGKNFQVMEKFDYDYIKALPKESDKNDEYCPSSEYPAINQIIITQEDITNFERQFLEVDKPIHKTEKDSLLKMIAGLLACNYGNNNVKNNSVKASEISGDLLRSAGIEGSSKGV